MGIAAAAQAVALGVVLRRLLPGARRSAPLTPPLHVPETRVSVVIPARNEAARITSCLTSLGDMPCVDEVIVVDDESTDGTAHVAKELGATVVVGAPLPAGWVGKPWALHQGLSAARNDVVVFLDADTIALSGLVPALVTQLDSYDIVSLAPSFLMSSTSEQMLHASMLNGLVYRFGAVGTSVDRPEQIYGNGQCLAFRRSWLIREGGLALAASHMNDDVALLRALKSRGARIAFADGRLLLQVRMYSSAREVWTEWGRSLPMNDVSTRSRQAFDLAALWLLLVLPVIHLMRGKASKLDVASMGLRLAMTVAVAPSYSGRKTGVYLSPLMDVAATTRLTQATSAPVRSWRGRRYTQPGTASPQSS